LKKATHETYQGGVAEVTPTKRTTQPTLPAQPQGTSVMTYLIPVGLAAFRFLHFFSGINAKL
jgi:hypothetical protein